MPANRDDARRRAIEKIELIRANSPLGAVEHETIARQAEVFAKGAGDRLLEAEVLLNAATTFAPSIDPPRVWQSLQHAQHIFQLNNIERKALSCRVAAAQVLFDIGEERNAIAAAQSVLSHSGLGIEDRAFAHILIALCHSHLGELDTAIAGLQVALPMAMECRSTPLLSQVFWAQGLTYIRLFLYRNHRELFRDWPYMPPILEQLPSSDFIQSLFAKGQKAMPDARPWSYLELGSRFFCALSQSGDGPLKDLSEFGEAHLSIDPPLAARAFFCLGVVSRQRADPVAALNAFQKALVVAEPLHSISIVRDVLHHISRIHEMQGNATDALSTFKRFSDIRLRGLLVPEGYRSFGFPVPAEASRAEELYPPVSILRSLEPSVIRSASRYIAGRIHLPISVGEVAEHCRVSRRTLETTFKRHKLITVAKYIKLLKLEQATVDLQNTNKSVQDISSGLGYKSSTSFGQDFKAQYGDSPLNWRRHRF